MKLSLFLVSALIAGAEALQPQRKVYPPIQPQPAWKKDFPVDDAPMTAAQKAAAVAAAQAKADKEAAEAAAAEEVTSLI